MQGSSAEVNEAICSALYEKQTLERGGEGAGEEVLVALSGD